MVITLIKSAFKNYPYVSNCVTYGCMCIGAEFSQQFIHKRLLTVADYANRDMTQLLETVTTASSVFAPFRSTESDILGEDYESPAQHPKTPPEKIDIDVLQRYAVIGFGINPTILYFWYKWLDNKYVGVTRKIIVKKVLLDQFIMTPPLYVIFYTSMSLMEGKSDILAECKAKFLTTYKTSCLFWFPATTINFCLIPSTMRVAYVGTCSFAWLNILLWLKRKEVD